MKHKNGFIATHLNARVILVVTGSDRYVMYLSLHLHTPFSPSLISLMVSVDVKHHVHLIIFPAGVRPGVTIRSDGTVKCVCDLKFKKKLIP